MCLEGGRDSGSFIEGQEKNLQHFGEIILILPTATDGTTFPLLVMAWNSWAMEIISNKGFVAPSSGCSPRQFCGKSYRKNLHWFSSFLMVTPVGSQNTMWLRAAEILLVTRDVFSYGIKMNIYSGNRGKDTNSVYEWAYTVYVNS